MIGVVLCVLVFALAAGAQQDPLLGTWKLNLAKSKYNPGPPPQSRVLKYEPFGSNGFKLTNDGVTASGEKTHAEGTNVMDGKDYPVADSQTVDTETNTRIDAYTTETVAKKGGKTVTVTRRTVSRDGKTLTVSAKGTTANGQPYSDVRVFDKQ
jgi:hypothetical protein